MLELLLPSSSKLVFAEMGFILRVVGCRNSVRSSADPLPNKTGDYFSNKYLMPLEMVLMANNKWKIYIQEPLWRFLRNMGLWYLNQSTLFFSTTPSSHWWRHHSRQGCTDTIEQRPVGVNILTGMSSIERLYL